MNSAAYEHCWIGDARVDLPVDLEQLHEQLVAWFPHGQAGLRKALTVVRQVNEQLHLIPKMSGFWDNVTIPFRTPQLGKYSLFSLKPVMDWRIQDPLLQGILNVQCGGKLAGACGKSASRCTAPWWATSTSARICWLRWSKPPTP